jgi:hypothetical protein
MAAAPRDPPAALLGAYTLQHQVPLERFYVDDASSMAGTTTRFSRDELAGCIRAAERDLRLITRVEAAESAAEAAAVAAGALRRQRERVARGGVQRQLVMNALAKSGAAAAEGLDVLVFGATDPWLECLCLAAGAKSVTTVEYQPLEYEHAQVTLTLTPTLTLALAPPPPPPPTPTPTLPPTPTAAAARARSRAAAAAARQVLTLTLTLSLSLSLTLT